MQWERYARGPARGPYPEEDALREIYGDERAYAALSAFHGRYYATYGAPGRGLQRATVLRHLHRAAGTDQATELEG